jgi:S1-C subfamily serine protease
MGIRIVCPVCKTSEVVGEEASGLVIVCQGCGKSIRVPKLARPEPPIRPERHGQPGDAGIRAARSRPLAACGAEDRNAPDAAESRANGSALLWILIGAGVAGLGLLGVAGLAVSLYLVQEPDPRPPVAAQAPTAVSPLLTGMQELAKPAPAQIDPDSVKRVKRSTVYLRVSQLGGGAAEGSGFFGLEPGLVVTNAHVVDMQRVGRRMPRQIEVVLNSGEADETRMEASIIGVDRNADLAVLRVRGDANRLPPPLPIDTTERLVETQKVYVFGFPFGAQLGKNITVSESSVASLRRDRFGAINQLQVNGGMNPGNSGGPVTDSRGVVVGVSVAIIRGTQINFAIPGDLVLRVLAGRVAETLLGEPYLDNGQRMLPLRLTCVDPERRIREVKVEVWTGPPGEPRSGSDRPPAPLPGDSPRLTVPVAYNNGVGTAVVALPPLGPGKVCWLQPVLVSVAGMSQWATALSFQPESETALDRGPATLQFKAPTELLHRTLHLHESVTARLDRRGTSAVATQQFDSDVLESLSPDPRGIGTFIRLTLAKYQSRGTLDDRPLPSSAAATVFLRRYSPTFLVNAAHSLRERGKRDFSVVPPPYLDDVEQKYEQLCNAYEACTVALPNRELRPAETWAVRSALFILADKKREIVDLALTCTYDGIRTEAGRRQAYLRCVGDIKGRGRRADATGGRVKGRALLDLEAGFLSLVKLTIQADLESEEGDTGISVTDEISLSRADGNSLGIAPATANQPTRDRN